ncbi:hypothetical protein [Amycolatopsis minnesotensis]|uniref:Uncharacterized protein n=1 Tax=Amycolatopsis minnesotensis TaxID=337894 RepID=A0ABN2S8P7_9PSEU
MITEWAAPLVLVTERQVREGAHLCVCGNRLTRCTGCGDRRCLRCDPYRSEDCSS